MAEKLQAAGIITRATERSKEQKQTEARITLEREYRERLFGNVRTELANYTLDGSVTIPDPIMLTLLRELVTQFFTRVSYEDTCLSTPGNDGRLK